MKQLSLAHLLRRLSQAFALPIDDRVRPRTPPADTPEREELRRREINRWMIIRIIFNLALLLLLASLPSNVDHVRALQGLLLLCANVTWILALVCGERPSRSVLNRWDEAAVFLALSLGLRIFA